MRRPLTIATLTLGLTAAVLAAPTTYADPTPGPAASATAPATSHDRAGQTPKKGAKRKGFTEADKTGFGTSRTRQSKAWFTLEGGRISEVFYPDLSTPSVRTLELTVTDGGGTDRQGKDMTTVVTRPDERSLRFTQVSTDNDGHYRVTEEVVTDPAHNALVLHIAVEPLDGAFHALEVRHEPALGNGSAGDRTQSSKHALKAVDPQSHVATTVMSSPRLTSTKDRRGV